MEQHFAQQAKNNNMFEAFIANMVSLSPSAKNLAESITDKLAARLPNSDALHAMNDSLVAQGRASALPSRQVASTTVVDVAPKRIDSATPINRKLSM